MTTRTDALYDAPVTELIRQAKNHGLTFEQDKWGQWHFRCSLMNQEAQDIVFVVQFRLPEIGKALGEGTMMPTITPIETHYNGHVFRSRLEARWATFLDTLGVRYDYEPEGFELPGGVRYLPDFWLPDHEVWIEIKPVSPSGEEQHKTALLVVATGYPAFTFFGPFPKLDEMSLAGPLGPDDSAYCQEPWVDPDTGESTAAWDLCYAWTECPACGLLGIEFEARADRLSCGHGRPDDRGHNGASKRLVAAYTAGRSARFEFGAARKEGGTSWS